MTHANEPATKGDLDILRKELHTFKEDILRHFDLTVETIRHDLLGANRDAIELLKDSQEDHERRIRQLERSSGVLTA